MNGKASVEILERLGGDENWWVRGAVARNRKTPIEILKKLKKDANVDVRNAAIATVKELKKKPGKK